jgi:hypothetical protein
VMTMASSPHLILRRPSSISGSKTNQDSGCAFVALVGGGLKIGQGDATLPMALTLKLVIV